MRLLVVAVLCGIAFARSTDPTQNVDIDIPGNYFWFPSPLPDETCTIKLQVKATRDAVITFSPRKSLIRKVYQAIIGAENNRYVCLVRGRDTRPIVDEGWNGILTGEWQTFLVEYCNGQLSLKREVGGQTQDLATYTDNDPYTGDEWYVGVTSLFAKSEWKVVSSESCGITNQRNSEPRDNNQPEEDNREPTRDDDRDEDEPNIVRDNGQRGTSRSGTSRGRGRQTSNDDSDGQNAGSGRQRGASRSGTSRGRGRQTSNDDSDGQNAGSDRQRGTLRSGSSRGRGRQTSNDDSDGQNAGSGRQRGASRSRTSRGRGRQTSNDDSDGQNAGSGRQRGTSRSGSSRGRGRQTSNDDSDGQNAGSGRQRGTSRSGSSRGRGRETSNDDGDGQNAGSGRQRGTSRSGTSRGRERGTSESSRRRSSSSDERAAGGNNQGSNSEKFQIDIKHGKNVQWKFIDQEIASPNNFRIPFWLKAERDCYIRLASRKDAGAREYYDIMIGFRENQFVCIFREGIQVRDEPKGNILNGRAFVDFVLSYDGKTLQLEKGGQILASYPDDNAFKRIKYIGISSHVDGKTIDSWWRFNKNSFKQDGGNNGNPSDDKSSRKSSRKSSKNSSKKSSRKNSRKSSSKSSKKSSSSKSRSGRSS